MVKQDGPCPLLQILKICCYNSDLPPQILEAENVPRVCDKLCPSLPATCVEFLAAGSPPGLQGLTAGFAGGSCWPHVWSQGLSCPSQAAGSSPPPLAWPFPHGWKCPGSAAGEAQAAPPLGCSFLLETDLLGRAPSSSSGHSDLGNSTLATHCVTFPLFLLLLLAPFLPDRAAPLPPCGAALGQSPLVLLVTQKEVEKPLGFPGDVLRAGHYYFFLANQASPAAVEQSLVLPKQTGSSSGGQMLQAPWNECQHRAGVPWSC